MSDTLENLLAKPIGIDAVPTMTALQQLAQSQAATQGQQIANAGNLLQLQGRQWQVNNFLGAQSQGPAVSLADLVAQARGGGAPAGAASPLANAAPGGGGGTAAPNYLTALSSSASPSIPGGMPGSSRVIPIAGNNGLAAAAGIAPTTNGFSQALPPGTMPSAATHSSGMPTPGQYIGPQISTVGAFQTAFGVPVPKGWAASIAFSNDPGSELKAAMEARRTRLQELFTYGNWDQAVEQAYQEGWLDPAHAVAAYDHPENRDGLLASLASPDKYQDMLEKYSGQSIQLNPATGQHEISPVALQAKQASAAATAQGTSQGELVNAGPLAAAKETAINNADLATARARAQQTSLGQQDARTEAGPGQWQQARDPATGQPLKNPDGTPRMVLMPTIVNSGAQAEQTLRAANGGVLPGGAPPAGSWGQGDPNAPNPLLGGVPSSMLRPNGALPAGAAPPAPGSSLGGAAPAAPGRSLMPAGGVGASGAGVPSVSQPAPGGVPPVPGISTNKPEATYMQSAGLDAAKSAVTADQGEVASALNKAQTAQQAQAQLLQVRNLVPQINTGSFADARQRMQNYLATFSPEFGQKFVAALTAGNIDPSKAGATQEFVKQSLLGAGAAEKDTLGSRGGYSALQLYQKSFPNLESQPTAIRDMSNLLLIAHQRDVDYATGANAFFQNARDGFMAGSGQYSPVGKFDAQFIKSNPPQVYVGAAAALNDKPFAVWSKGLTPSQQSAALGILWRADPTATVLGRDGTTRYTNPGLTAGGQ